MSVSNRNMNTLLTAGEWQLNGRCRLTSIAEMYDGDCCVLSLKLQLLHQVVMSCRAIGVAHLITLL